MDRLIALVTLVPGLVPGLAGCGDDLAPTIRVVAEGARWMAVRASPDAAWERKDGEDVSFDARGVFEVAVVCREDIGDGFTLRATADDGLRYDQELCYRRGSVMPQLAITGRADVIYVGYSASYLPNIVGQAIEPGTYDVVAQRLSSEVPRATDRVQVLRDVVVDEGSAPIPIDVERLGLPPARATITIDGAPAAFAYITGATANGTWFGFSGTGLLTLPVELARPDDVHLATIYQGEAWAETPVHPGANEVALPPDEVDAAFRFDAPPAVTWRSATAWERVTFQVSQVTTSGPGLPRWRLIAYAGAFATTDGAAMVDLPVPEVAGWRASWMADPARERFLYARWERARSDGGRGGIYRVEQR